MTITITAEDISKGDPGNCSTCPIALAVSRETGVEVSYVEVDGFEIVINGKHYVTPAEAEQFISRFDNGHPVQPFTFELP